MWLIRFRRSDGVGELTFDAPTREDAEMAFAEYLMDSQEFGVILTCEPGDGSLVPQA